MQRNYKVITDENIRIKQANTWRYLEDSREIAGDSLEKIHRWVKIAGDSRDHIDMDGGDSGEIAGDSRDQIGIDGEDSWKIAGR